MTDRAAALRSLRSSRTDGLPPPPPLAPAGDATGGSPPANAEEPRHREPRRKLSSTDAAQQRSVSDVSQSHEATSLDGLLADPVRACREMGNLRENMPARPLNVDLTPEVAAAFDQQCRTLRVKKKDVVELLLRGWLQHQGQDLG